LMFGKAGNCLLQIPNLIYAKLNIKHATISSQIIVYSTIRDNHPTSLSLVTRDCLKGGGMRLK
jgi:hypothetical protein